MQARLQEDFVTGGCELDAPKKEPERVQDHMDGKEPHQKRGRM